MNRLSADGIAAPDNEYKAKKEIRIRMNVTYGAAEGALEKAHLGYGGINREEWLDRKDLEAGR